MGRACAGGRKGVNMQGIPFKQVDVFTSVRFKGNPVAVVLKADTLATEQMQRIANWTNLSETTFVVPSADPKADYRVRIFTPAAELPFAGHPTVGTAHALLEAGLVRPKNGTLVQECGVGQVTLNVDESRDGRWISFELPQPSAMPLAESTVAEIETILGVEVSHQYAPCVIDAGVRWVVAQLRDAEVVLAARPDLQRMASTDLHAEGVVIFGGYPTGSPTQIEVRAFAPGQRVNEYPVCGSRNGCVAAFIRHTKQTARFGAEYLASQGGVLGRAGRIRLSISESSIRVGGQAVTCVDGQLFV